MKIITLEQIVFWNLPKEIVSEAEEYFNSELIKHSGNGCDPFQVRRIAASNLYNKYESILYDAIKKESSFGK